MRLIDRLRQTKSNKSACRLLEHHTGFKRLGLVPLILALSFGVPSASRSEVVTLKGERYYRTFEKDFTLENNTLSDIQAKHILNLVETRYKNGLSVNTDMIDIWETLDNVYEGKLYGKIMLTIFDCYLNGAFNAFYNPLKEENDSSFRSYGGFLRQKLSPGARDDRLHNKVEAYIHDYVKCLPDFAVCASFDRYDIHGMDDTEQNTLHYKVVETTRSGHVSGDDRSAIYNAEKYAVDEVLAARPTDEKLINGSVYSAVNTLEKYINDLELKIPKDDSVIQDGSFDKHLVKIADQYAECSLVYSEDLGKILTKQLSEMCLNHVTNDTYAKEIKDRAAEYHIKLKQQPKTQQRF